MAGIYIHVPFCKKACHYCDFHFSTSLKFKENVLHAMREEIKLRADFLSDEVIETIYFGGGSPSILNVEEISGFLDLLQQTFSISSEVEITLEANPDDLSKKKLKDLFQAGINRLSIGVQSFRNEDLKQMNRAHDDVMAKNCLNLAREVGFENLNVDLIYGLPKLSPQEWEKNVQTLLSFKPEHISAYCLTIEDKTAFGKWVKEGKLAVPNDEVIIEQFTSMTSLLSDYEHYEISNFSLPGLESKHNTAYWKGKKYLGIGPSAHSFNGQKRFWNIRNNPLYAKAIESNSSFYEEEFLSDKDRFNEFILTSLRTNWGVDLSHLEKNFGKSTTDLMMKDAAIYFKSADLHLKNNVLYLTEKGKLVADKITSDLFVL